MIKRFDSLREGADSMFPEACKLAHLGIKLMPRRSTLSDANARCKECVFEAIYKELYSTYKDELSSDSRNRQVPKWLSRLQIIDSATITLFSNQGAGRHPKNGKKKGGLKAHANNHATRGCRRTCASPQRPILALDRAYINYAKFGALSELTIYIKCKSINKHSQSQNGSSSSRLNLLKSPLCK